MEENYQMVSLYNHLKNQVILSPNGNIVDVDIQAIISYFQYCGIDDDEVLDKLINLIRKMILLRREKEER